MRTAAIDIIVCVVILANCTCGALAQTRPSVDDLNKQVVALGKLMETGSGLYFHQLEKLVDTLAALPVGDDRRLGALAIAGRYAKVDELSARAKTIDDFRLDATRLNWSWRILRSLQVIREGARAEDLVPILGAPTRRFYYPDGAESWHWQYNSMMHVNPLLEVKVKKGLVVESEIKRG